MEEVARRQLILVCVVRILQLLRKKYARHRSIGVRPLFRNRVQLGDGHNLIEELRFDYALFFNYTRLTYERFDYLLSLVGPMLTKKKKMRTVLLPHQRLAMTLRFLAIGDSQATLSFAYRCGRATVSVIIRETLTAIVKVLHKVAIPGPKSEDDWKAIAAGFWEKWNMPHCVGAIDGKHINIQSPQTSGSLYFNYKKTFSIVLMAIVDADYAFIAADVGGEGSLNDGAIFKDSIFGQKLFNKKLKLPSKVNLPNTDVDLDYFFVGDGAFQLRTDLMKPYAARKLSLKEAIYNYRLSRARRVVENAFGILAARWRIFRQPLCCKLETADLIVMASMCLHNFIIHSREQKLRDQYIPSRFVDVEMNDGTVNEGAWRNYVEGESGAFTPAPPSRAKNCSKTATDVREILTEYFSANGSVPWQIERVKKGFWGAYIDKGDAGSESETDA